MFFVSGQYEYQYLNDVLEILVLIYLLLLRKLHQRLIF